MGVDDLTGSKDTYALEIMGNALSQTPIKWMASTYLGEFDLRLAALFITGLFSVLSG